MDDIDSPLIPGSRYEYSAPLWPPACVENARAILARAVPRTDWRVTVTDGVDDRRHWTVEHVPGATFDPE